LFEKISYFRVILNLKKKKGGGATF
jgi:hypothetical protein